MICMPCYHPLISIHVPREGDDPTCGAGKSARTNFNPRPPRGGRPWQPVLYAHVSDISIHVPREGDDPRAKANLVLVLVFQSTSPARGTTSGRGWNTASVSFQSTSPARGTTTRFDYYWPVFAFQSTSPARGTTPGIARGYYDSHISIHVPREGDDPGTVLCGFLRIISIHVPREGDDRSYNFWTWKARHFNPRPPRGGRPHMTPMM